MQQQSDPSRQFNSYLNISFGLGSIALAEAFRILSAELRDPGRRHGSSGPSRRSYHRGQKIGEGWRKTAHQVAGDPQLVILTMKEFPTVGPNTTRPTTPAKAQAQLTKELDCLAKIKSLGVPTVDIVATGINRHGWPYVVMPHYAAWGKGPWIRGMAPHFNAQSARDIEQIMSTLRNNGALVHDLQFLIAANGKVVVTDPEGIEFGKVQPTQALELVGSYRFSRNNRQSILTLNPDLSFQDQNGGRGSWWFNKGRLELTWANSSKELLDEQAAGIFKNNSAALVKI